MIVQSCHIWLVTASIVLKTLMHCVGIVGVRIMARISTYIYSSESEFTPEGIAKLCSGLSMPNQLAILNKLDLAWNESKPFDAEIEIPLKEHPHVHILNIEVDPVTQQVTIERKVSSERFSSYPECRLAGWLLALRLRCLHGSRRALRALELESGRMCWHLFAPVLSQLFTSYKSDWSWCSNYVRSPLEPLRHL